MAQAKEDGDCMIWQGQFRSNAPRIWRGNDYVSVRALVMESLGKRRPGRIFFGTSCGNERCICPDHIVQRTPTDHHARIVRLASSGTSLAVRTAKTAAIMRAKFGKVTMEQVREIRASEKTNKALAAEYGVALETLREIRVGQRWRELGGSNPFAGLMR